jgi:uncharacterized membrane protein (DUF4010 family)
MGGVDPSPLLQQLGISLLLGLLVGLQRQRTAPGMPGVRTFPLITVFGTLAGSLSLTLGGWMVAAGMLAVVVVVSYANFLRLKHADADPGTTTEMASLLMYAVGAYLAVGPMVVGVVVGGGVAVLLHLKPEMHRFVDRLGEDDLRAVMQFVLITCIILPVLPNRTFGPLGVFNPFETWLIVVLIVGLGLAGYIAWKFFGRGAGIVLGGVLGGLISSTATTVSYARQARGDRDAAGPAAVVIMVASTVAFVRVLAAAAVVSETFARRAAAPLLIMALLALLPSLFLWFRNGRHSPEAPPQQNPTHLKSAVVFAVMYTVVLWALAAARQYVADPRAVYAVAAISGLTDMDAVTLSMARLSLSQPEVVEAGWRLVLVAGLANLLGKTLLAGALGGLRMMLLIGALFAIPTLGGTALLLLW